jgi:hypothetical protein
MRCQRLCLIAALAAVTTIAAVKNIDAAPGPEHARLTAMCGTWDVEMTFWFRPGVTRCWPPAI